MKKNQLISNNINAVNKAVNILSNEELTVIGFYHDSLSKPTIEIEHHPKCNKYIDAGQATYYRHEGHYRFGQFELNGCRVIWKERDISRLH
ncbi:hypothetical protein J3U21_06560 [Gilliamella sp. B2776]|uniref:hypothetical protein n=1 Tax=unclassified Gilliamella TaxID=2685620 RepID=UPI00226AF8E0|nr:MULTISPECIES: hypothetical protein [unclassified Gilliamella]MCX8650038.1 hypothetical protein [Gilliamella sp. B2779]MCX8654971.1 hypothetical protein [Gilliamella sp. B2737]MCX8656451.1 hypothetical protein [Gilliamella sp. B2894]MCX8665677.1 hypothetical protein [Gilliamella sp. B2887]MCX8691811.1 hypothetical protein [Gilliamella sp. B2776]